MPNKSEGFFLLLHANLLENNLNFSSKKPPSPLETPSQGFYLVIITTAPINPVQLVGFSGHPKDLRWLKIPTGARLLVT